MGFTIVPDKATGDVFTEANWDTHIRDNFNTGVPVLIASTTLGASAASITFSSIPQTWAHLRAVGYIRGDSATVSQDGLVRFNGDSGSNYDRQYMSAAGAAVGAGENFGITSGLVIIHPSASAPANLFSGFVLDIPHYTSTAGNKTAFTEASHKIGTASGNLNTALYMMAWRNNAAITQVAFLPGTGNFVAGSRISLYGMP